MRSNEERVAAVKARIAEKENQKKRRLGYLMTASSMAACIALIIVLSGFIPDIIKKVPMEGMQKYTAAASIFGSGAESGYILIALIAFVLGISVTIFCSRMRHYIDRNNHAQGEQEEKND